LICDDITAIVKQSFETNDCFNERFGKDGIVDDVKSRLIDVAGEAFGEKGYDAVGVREICQLANANVAAVNYHFGDKRALYVACLRSAQSCRVDELAIPEWPANFSAADKLRVFIHGMLESKLASTRPRWHLELMLREMARPTDACREIVEDYIRPMAKSLAEILQELMPGSGWKQKSWLIGFSVIAQVLFYYVNQPVVRILMGPEGFESLSVDVLTDHITRFCLAAIGQGPAVSANVEPEGSP
jgi:TetR/AcrR family transcriptional regulator, regulator of cefoperazone and chloramphenicol sensitivity